MASSIEQIRATLDSVPVGGRGTVGTATVYRDSPLPTGAEFCLLSTGFWYELDELAAHLATTEADHD